MTPPSDDRAWKELRRTLDIAYQEQRRARRWGIFFKLVGLLYVTVLVVALVMPNLDRFNAPSEPHLAVVQVNGVIAADADANANAILSGVRAALDHAGTQGLMLSINSGGGSPVQADRVWRGIKRLRDEHPDIPFVASIGDFGASGAYYIASAMDDIYADRASLVGSIGVVSAGFGFEGLADKIGVERRVITAGENKGLLDPFKPLDDAEVEHWQGVLNGTHTLFIDRVKSGRGARLADDDSLFSGLIWNGDQALELGLIDGHLSPREFAEDELGLDTIVDFTPRIDPIEEFTRSLGVGISSGFGQLLTRIGL